jgi:ubiquinone/menaquinone biosynthesis C-methylase UbiE
MQDIHIPTIGNDSRPWNPGGAGAVARMNCDRIARFYQALEYLSFGGLLQACRVRYLRDVAGCHKALVCGDGDGRFLSELLRTNPVVDADFVDLSAGMAALARRRIDAIGSAASGQVRFHVGDVLEFWPWNSKNGRYDLITAHFFLDCFDDREVVVVTRKLAAISKPGAQLLLSDFRIPTNGILHDAGTAIVRVLYGAFRLATGLRVNRLPNYEDALEQAGFRKQKETLRLGGLLVASLWQRL